MAFNVTDFNNQYSGDYARPNLFEVQIGGWDSKMFVKAASIPATQVGMVEVPYQNRKLKVPGDRTFADWTITVINDQNYVLREALLMWQRNISGFSGMESIIGVSEAHKTIEIQPYSRDGSKATFMHTVYGWPTEVGSIELNWETVDAVQEYTVNFAVSWDDGGTGDTVDVLN